MPAYEMIQLSRDCEAVQIPSGNKVKLSKGAHVRVTQSLGGSFTVITDEGYMVRIAGENADAIGKQAPAQAGTRGSEQSLSLDQLVWNELRTCYDPEIPINIVELGLVYECRITPLADGGNKVDVKMTLTAPGCGMGESLKRDAQAKIERLPGVREISVELVWEPPWDQCKMSQAAKLQLGMM